MDQNLDNEESWYDSNKEQYLKSSTVADYIGQTYVEPCESWFIQQFHKKLASWSMLDIAVGAGRTTLHFAPLVKNYVGVDYSPAMITECETSFGNSLGNARFHVSDMSDLSEFDDSQFDFVLISYNAISALPISLRKRTYSEVARVLKPGGKFYFSAHNLQNRDRTRSLKRWVSFRHPINSLRKLRDTIRWFFIHNSPIQIYRAKRSETALINDNAHGVLLTHYYIRPREQVRQLENLFDEIRCFGRAGEEIKDEESLLKNSDSWLFYLCTPRK